MKLWMVAVLLIVVCLGVYWPQRQAEFILDDYYTVVRNPLIKNPSLYQHIWTSRLFDAYQSSGYIKFGYYRPVLQSSWIVDYRLFGLKACGFQWLNLLIHALNCFLVYILLWQLFGQSSLSLKASLLFCVLPTQEWAVRYVTGRGDELSALFALVSLASLLWVFKTGFKKGYILVFLFWTLSALTREVAISYILYAFLVYCSLPLRGEGKGGGTLGVNRFSLCWILIGSLPFLLLWSIIPKQGNILVFHVFYLASVGLCLWLAQLRLRWVIVLIALFAAVSFYQGRFWTTEENLLRHTRSLEWWPRTVVDQQLLMKYDEDIPAIKDMVTRSRNPLIKAMWLRRLGAVSFERRDLSGAEDYFTQAVSFNPFDVDALDSLAVVYHNKGQEDESLKCLNRALAINPSYPDTLRTLGIYYYIHKDLPQARVFLTRCLFFDPNNVQAHELLRLANKTI
jgi:hypothetical protein